MLKALAVDFGASSGKAMLGSYDGVKLVLTETHRFLNEPVMCNGIFQWDFLRLFHELKQGLLKSAHGEGNKISSIGVDTWGVDFGLLDRTGLLLGNPVHYRDKRNEGMLEASFKIVPAKDIYMKTGIQFIKFNTLNQLLYLTLNKSPQLEIAKTMLMLPDLFNYFLTGEKHSEYTITSTTQLMDPEKGDWAYDLINSLGFPAGIFQKLIDTGTIIGDITNDISQELGAGKPAVVAVAGHDTACAVMSAPAVSGKYAYLSSGTWSLLGIESEKPIINEKTYKLNYTNEGGYGRNIRLLKNIMGLWIYQECKKSWDMNGEPASYDELESAAEKAKPFRAFIDPDSDIFYLQGNMPQKVVDFCRKTGQEIPENKAEIVRCIFESLALKYRITLEGLDQIAGYRIPAVHIMGGGSRNSLLCGFTACASGRLVTAGPVEATAAGNIMCQLIALGEISGLRQGRELIKKSFLIKEYYPSNVSGWEEAYSKFKTILEQGG